MRRCCSGGLILLGPRLLGKDWAGVGSAGMAGLGGAIGGLACKDVVGSKMTWRGIAPFALLFIIQHPLPLMPSFLSFPHLVPSFQFLPYPLHIHISTSTLGPVCIFMFILFSSLPLPSLPTHSFRRFRKLLGVLLNLFLVSIPKYYCNYL